MNEKTIDEKLNCSERIPSTEHIIGAPGYICNSGGACPYQWKLDESETRTFCTYEENILPKSSAKKILEDFSFNY